MNTTTPGTMKFLAQIDLMRRHAQEMDLLDRATSDLDRFQELCDTLRAHGLEFSLDVFVSAGMKICYTIKVTTEEQAAHLEELLTTLHLMGFKTSEVQRSDSSCCIFEHYHFTGDEAPDFSVFVSRSAPALAEVV